MEKSILDKLISSPWLLVFVGGGLGSLCRYYIADAVNIYYPDRHTLATLIANIASCLILGMATGLAVSLPGISRYIVLFIGAGFCGGFSTFSTFTMEVFHLLRREMFIPALLNIFTSVLSCLLSFWAGFVLTRNYI
jgi:fluoride exporter